MPVPILNAYLKPSQWLILLWLLAGALMLADLRDYPVRRTQEARVLETAREMLHSPTWRGWVIPVLDEQVRLRKPPLAYWTTAIAYKIGGISEGVGRMPSAIEGWLVLGLTFLIGRRLFSQRVGLLAAACLFGSYAFLDYFRMAETDAPAALGVTLAMYGFISADADTEKSKRLLWYHAAAAGIALALMAKGGPALYPVIFLIAWSAFDKRWDRLRKIFTTGAILTFLILGVSWFVIAFSLDFTNSQQFWQEIRNNVEGGGHRTIFLAYIPWILVQTAPWSILLCIAIAWAAKRWREPNVRTTILWIASVLLPLCITGNKQPHYLLPAIPAMMVLVGAVVSDHDRGIAIAKWVTVYGVVITGIVWLVVCAAGWHGLPKIGALLVGAALLAAGASMHFLPRGRTISAWAALSVASAIIWIGTLSVFIPTMQPDDPRTVANTLHQKFGDGPYVFFGEKSLPLKFYLADHLVDATTRQNAVTLSYAGDEGDASPSPPAPLVERDRLRINKKPLVVYTP